MVDINNIAKDINFESLGSIGPNEYGEKEEEEEEYNIFNKYSMGIISDYG